SFLFKRGTSEAIPADYTMRKQESLHEFHGEIGELHLHRCGGRRLRVWIVMSAAGRSSGVKR
ncbi:MAG: hypothetical protein ACRDBF_04300, partial [Plesiomonas shigelloides]